ncbi:MAG: triose-phosphate isomerase [Gemmatimonadetes bacterium]|nr:triose-phosphate isomerase [Gemmatimonadota bacterium]
MAVIAGNWKMHHGPRATRDFFSSLVLPPNAGAHELLIFPTALSLAAAVDAPGRDPRVQLGVQNIHWEDKGAFTGEVSAAMAREAGAAFALVGHSERRHLFGETDKDVSRKIAAARRHGLVPVVCVGETLEERRGGRVEEVILGQLDAALPALTDVEGRFLLAYEPVWAIGTGETATPDDAAAAQGTLRARLDEALGPSRSTRVPILYGGSVKPDNARDLLAAPDVDGVLVGGASLDAGSFAALVEAAG